MQHVSDNYRDFYSGFPLFLFPLMTRLDIVDAFGSHVAANALRLFNPIRSTNWSRVPSFQAVCGSEASNKSPVRSGSSGNFLCVDPNLAVVVYAVAANRGRSLRFAGTESLSEFTALRLRWRVGVHLSPIWSSLSSLIRLISSRCVSNPVETVRCWARISVICAHLRSTRGTRGCR